jgi:hypothetical protein
MGRPLYTNNAATYLAFGITNTATTMQVSANAGSLFPNPTGGDYFYVSLISLSGPIIEIVKCTARSGDIFTIERGQEGTTPLYWNMGDNVQLRITAAGMNYIAGSTASTTLEQSFTATQGQTVFTLTNFDYSPGNNNLAVFVNGSKQVSGTNYTETNVNTVTFTTGLNAGDIVEFLSNLSVAAGTIYATDINYNEGSTGAVTRTLESKLQESVSVKDFGAVGNGTTDDTAAIQEAINAIVATASKGTLFFPAGTYKITSSLTINVSYVSIFGESAVLNFSSLTSGAALVVNTTVSPAYSNSITFISGIKLIGNSTTGNVIGIQYTSTQDVSHISVDNCNINTFGVGESFETNSYLISHKNTDIWDCTVGIQNLSGFANNGENISYVGGAIFNNGTNVIQNNSNGDMNFTNVSFDYPTVAQFSITAGELHFVNCHIENAAIPLFSTNSVNTVTSFTNCLFIQQASSGSIPYVTINGIVDFHSGRMIGNVGTSPVVTVNSGGSLNWSSSLEQYSGSQFFNLVSGSTYTINSPYTILINGHYGTFFSSSSTISGTYISSSGNFLGGAAIILSSLNTWYSLGYGTANGLYVFRDTTSGGTAAFIADTTGGAHSLYNGITGFNMNYGGVSGQMSVEITSGTVPRNIVFTVLQTGS